MFYWIIGVLLESFWTFFWKNAIDSAKLSSVLFKFFSPIFWIILISILIFFNGYQLELFSDIFSLILLIVIILIWYLKSLWEQKLMKKLKLSEIIPYSKIDKVFIIIIWFILYYWTEKETSLTTFLISLITVLIVIWFTIDIKKIKFPKYIWSYLFIKFLSAFLVIWTWVILLKYNSITYTATKIVIIFVLCIISIIVLKQSIKPLFHQTKSFYYNRIGWTLISRIWFLIWLFIIEKQWIVIATLLGFLWLVFNIFWMKFLLKDNPNLKQISLWVIVTLMIWIWYYFK